MKGDDVVIVLDEPTDAPSEAPTRVDAVAKATWTRGRRRWILWRWSGHQGPQRVLRARLWQPFLASWQRPLLRVLWRNRPKYPGIGLRLRAASRAHAPRAAVSGHC